MSTLDPRHENCRGFRLDANGKVVGVQLQYVELPETKYQLVAAKLLDEYEAAGAMTTTVYVYEADGTLAEERVLLGYPWTGHVPTANTLAPGNTERPVKHCTESVYNAPAEIGPLCIYVADRNGNPISDAIGGIGLPGYINHETGDQGGRHVSFVFKYKERSAAPPPPPPPPPADEGDDEGTVRALLTQQSLLNIKLTALAKHLGLDV